MKQILAVIFAILASTNALAMPPAPPYSAGNSILLGSGNPLNAWVNETPTPGNGTTAASQQFQFQGAPGKAGTPFSVDIKFSGAPGTTEIDVQLAATDSDTNYQTCSNCNITTFDSTNNTAHLDAVLTNARFVRLLMRARANSVSVTATVTGG